MEDSSSSFILDTPNPTAPGLKTLGYQHQPVTTSTKLKNEATDESLRPCCFINFPTFNKAVLSFCIINFIFGFILCTLSVCLAYYPLAGIPAMVCGMLNLGTGMIGCYSFYKVEENRLDKTRRWNPRPSRIGRLILSALCIVASIVALPVVLTWHPDCNHYFSLIITVASFIVASFFINLLLTILTSISTCCLSNEDNNKLQYETVALEMTTVQQQQQVLYPSLLQQQMQQQPPYYWIHSSAPTTRGGPQFSL